MTKDRYFVSALLNYSAEYQKIFWFIIPRSAVLHWLFQFFIHMGSRRCFCSLFCLRRRFCAGQSFWIFLSELRRSLPSWFTVYGFEHWILQVFTFRVDPKTISFCYSVSSGGLCCFCWTFMRDFRGFPSFWFPLLVALTVKIFTHHSAPKSFMVCYPVSAENSALFSFGIILQLFLRILVECELSFPWYSFRSHDPVHQKFHNLCPPDSYSEEPSWSIFVSTLNPFRYFRRNNARCSPVSGLSYWSPQFSVQIMTRRSLLFPILLAQKVLIHSVRCILSIPKSLII